MSLNWNAQPGPAVSITSGDSPIGSRTDFYNESKTVRAVGILGSDVYDKLLVLQALRPTFPNALFFTTDADTRFLHPAEFEWARGLVMLSGYGLETRSGKLASVVQNSARTETRVAAVSR